MQSYNLSMDDFKNKYNDLLESRIKGEEFLKGNITPEKRVKAEERYHVILKQLGEMVYLYRYYMGEEMTGEEIFKGFIIKD